MQANLPVAHKFKKHLRVLLLFLAKLYPSNFKSQGLMVTWVHAKGRDGGICQGVSFGSDMRFVCYMMRFVMKVMLCL
ncbi:hypothetical protein C9I98_12160 [Photobacterium sanctipauli]|uniref:Uncharacterized protein n=1 Tax=Photobacterium sanctipauli TaxID=1342794 RepID=A0A2T3NTX2_9GAMM|nr:hypothetical protein C9I98_12160 [Photobacterium sanctipauli]